MDPDNQYYEDGVQRVLRLMKDTFGDYFKAYFNGELLNVTEEFLPCIMVTTSTAQVVSGPTTADDIVETVIVIIVENKKDDIGADAETDLTDFRVRKLIMGQDPATAQYLPNTVLYAIRKHLTMGNDTLQSDTTVDFTPNTRGATQEIATQEGYVTISIKRRIYVPSRD